MQRISPRSAIGLAIATLVVGYGDLWRGGATLSAMMLTVGYGVMVPIAIMTIPRRKRSPE